ncbi:MAG TPA: BON domain-containing protein [Puia sp.]|nr:BON domain-containing protein [Puia sp.]
MKKTTRCLLTAVMICIASSILFFSCGNKDASILAAIDSKKKDMKEMSGITASVDKGVVTLSGEYANADSKSMCEQSVKGIPGVKQVVDNCTVAPPPPPPSAPVVIAADDPLTKDVADAIKDYPGVSATVKDGEVTLNGDIKRASLQKLMMSLHTLKPKRINNQLTIK